jgi:signal transduction histidine kinase
VDAVRARPEMRNREILIRTAGDMRGTFDPQKIERVFFNLVLNACEASVTTQGEIEIELRSSPTLFEIRVIDHGSGVPSAICHTLFDPFVSSGKSNGTGLGLAIVSKVIHDHGGSVAVEETSMLGTTFLVRLPRVPQVLHEAAHAISL